MTIKLIQDGSINIPVNYFDNTDKKIRPPEFITGKAPFYIKLPNPDYIPPDPASLVSQTLKFFTVSVPNPNYHPDTSLYYKLGDPGRPVHSKVLTYPKYSITPEIQAYYDYAVKNQGNKNEVFRWLAAADVAQREHNDTIEHDWIYFYFLPEVINRTDFYFITKEPVEYVPDRFNYDEVNNALPVPRYEITTVAGGLSFQNRSLGTFDSVPYYRASAYLPTYSSGKWQEFLITAAIEIAVVTAAVITAGAAAPALGATDSFASTAGITYTTVGVGELPTLAPISASFAETALPELATPGILATALPTVGYVAVPALPTLAAAPVLGAGGSFLDSLPGDIGKAAATQGEKIAAATVSKEVVKALTPKAAHPVAAPVTSQTEDSFGVIIIGGAILAVI